MKKTLLKGIVGIAAVVAMTACTDGIGTGFGNGEGHIALATEIDASFKSARASRADFTHDIDPSKLTVKLTSADGSMSQTWPSVADFDTDKKFTVGSYTIEAYYGDESSEGFESPRYYGAQNITVRENETTKVALTATRANALVEIKYTDAYINYMTEYSAQVHAEGGAYHDYDADETRPVYVNPGNVEVLVSFTKPNGNGGTMSAAEFEAVAGTLYTVTVDLNNGSGSGVINGINITLESDVLDESVEVDISDEVLMAAAPEVTAEGFTTGTAIDFIAGMAADDATGYKFNILARAGLRGITLTTASASLLEQGWPAEVDLMDTDEATVNTMKALGLQARGVFTNPDKMAVVDLTDVVKHIRYINGGNNLSEFTIVVRDRNGKVSDPQQPVTLSLQAQPISLSLADACLYEGSDVLKFNVSYNGGPVDNVKYDYFHIGQATWVPLNVTYDTTRSRAATTFLATAKVDKKSETIRLRATAPGLDPVELTVERRPMVVPAGEANAYAKRAIIPVTIGKDDTKLAEMLAGATLMVSTDGTNFSAVPTTTDAATKTITATGLAANTTYTAKIANLNMDLDLAPEFTIVTEEAAQFDDANMDSWASEKKGDYQYLWTVGNGSTWATLNPLTTSTNGSGSGNGLTTGGCSYKATSGTIPANGRSTQSSAGGGTWGSTIHSDGHTEGNANLHSDRAHSGSNAALIRTVGWGSGNDASVSYRCKNITAGELYLGKYENNAPVYGIQFASRPSKLAFYYHYNVVSSGNGDYGSVEAILYDTDGNELATASRNLTEQGEYQLVELPFEYKNIAAKAGKISVIFKSSANESARVKDKKYMTYPGSNNTSGGEYVGSELYIDDITLIY